MKKLCCMLALLLALAIAPAAIAEDWEHDEPDYLEVAMYEGETISLTGYLQEEIRWTDFWTGNANVHVIYCLYLDQPLDFTMLRGGGSKSACQLEYVQVVSGVNLFGYVEQRVNVEGVVRFADEDNGYDVAVTVADAKLSFVTDDYSFEVDDSYTYYDPEYGVDTIYDMAEMTGDAHLRDYHGLNGNSLGVMKKGEQVVYYGLTMIDDRGVPWYNVFHEKFGSGWVSGKYAVLGYFSGEPAVVGYVYADGGKSNMRKGPGLDYKIWCTFKKGDYAVYLGNDAWDDRGVQWYNIRYRDYEGWVSSKYTSLIFPDQPAYEDWNVRATGNVYVRKGPGLDYGICSVLKPDAELPYLGDTYYDDRGVAWYSVDSKNGHGWVSSRYSQLVTD